MKYRAFIKEYKMTRKYFEDYGELEWLEPEDYYEGPWKFLRMVGTGEDQFDIVIKGDYPYELRYTNI